MVQSDKFYNIIQLQIHKQKGIKRPKDTSHIFSKHNPLDRTEQWIKYKKQTH